MLFFGIDPSITETGVSVIDEDGYYDVITCKTSNKKKIGSVVVDILIEERLAAIIKRIKTFFSSYDNMLENKIFIEDIAYSKHSDSANKLIGLHYFIRMELYRENLNYEIVNPSTLKKFVLGKENKKGTKKQQMLLHIFKRWGVEFNNDNKADAFALAQYGRYQNGYGKDAERKTDE